jgi:hypothetical protein
LVIAGTEGRLNSIAFNSEEPIIIVGDSLVRKKLDV